MFFFYFSQNKRNKKRRSKHSRSSSKASLKEFFPDSSIATSSTPVPTTSNSDNSQNEQGQAVPPSDSEQVCFNCDELSQFSFSKGDKISERKWIFVSSSKKKMDKDSVVSLFTLCSIESAFLKIHMTKTEILSVI